MVDIVRVNADYGRDFHHLTDHMTKLRNFTRGEIRELSAFPFHFKSINSLSDDFTQKTT